MDRWTLSKEVGVGLLLGAILTGNFWGFDFEVLILGFLGLCLTVFGVIYGKEEEHEL